MSVGGKEIPLVHLPETKEMVPLVHRPKTKEMVPLVHRPKEAATMSRPESGEAVDIPLVRPPKSACRTCPSDEVESAATAPNAPPLVRMPVSESPQSSTDVEQYVESYVKQIRDNIVYENAVHERDVHHDVVERGLNITLLHIIKKGRVLTGGMAIDLALRKVGARLYPDNTLPDYDYFSPEFHRDSYDIAKACVAAGLKEVSAINALHVSTMRTRTLGIVVSDATYMPPQLLGRVPTVHCSISVVNPSTGQSKTATVLVVHPHYQMIDQHLSLSLPYGNAPMETILHRWGKDMKRYDMLHQHYPVKALGKAMGQRDSARYVVPNALLFGQCLGAEMSLNYWLQHCRALGFSQHPGSVWDLAESKGGGASTTFRGIDAPSMYSSDLWKSAPFKATKKAGGVKWFNAMMDKLPRSVTVAAAGVPGGVFRIYDTSTDLIAAHDTDLGWHVLNLQMVMKELLVLHILYEKKWASHAYVMARDMMYWAANRYVEHASDGARQAQFSILLPTNKVYGERNWPITTINLRNKHLGVMNIQAPPDRSNMPKRVYLDQKKINDKHYEYDPAQSPLYQFSGEERSDPFRMETLPR